MPDDAMPWLEDAIRRTLLFLVPAERNMVGRVLSRAKDLLEEGRAASDSAALSPRQSEIFDFGDP